MPVDALALVREAKQPVGEKPSDGIRRPGGLQLAMYGFGNANSIEQLWQQVLKFDQSEVVDRRRVRHDDHREPR